jgi:hypothetical protein
MEVEPAPSHCIASYRRARPHPLLGIVNFHVLLSTRRERERRWTPEPSAVAHTLRHNSHAKYGRPRHTTGSHGPRSSTRPHDKVGPRGGRHHLPRRTFPTGTGPTSPGPHQNSFAPRGRRSHTRRCYNTIRTGAHSKSGCHYMGAMGTPHVSS